MKNLKEYINEGIFDVDDNIDNMEYEIFQPLRSPLTFLDTYERLCKHFQKKRWLVGPQKVQVGNIYILFNRHEFNYPMEYPYFTYRVSLCIPNGDRWDVYHIRKNEFVNSTYNLPKIANDKTVMYAISKEHSNFFKKQRFDTQFIFELPDSYKGVINMFKK